MKLKKFLPKYKYDTVLINEAAYYQEIGYNLGLAVAGEVEVTLNEEKLTNLIYNQELYDYTEHIKPQKMELHYRPAKDCWNEIAKAIIAALPELLKVKTTNAKL